MNKILTSLIIKFIGTFVFAFIAFGIIINNPWPWVLLIAVIVTILNYVADLVIFPMYGNLAAAASDGIFAGIIAYIVSLTTPAHQATLFTMAVFALLIAVGEYFFHLYLSRTENALSEQ